MDAFRHTEPRTQLIGKDVYEIDAHLLKEKFNKEMEAFNFFHELLKKGKNIEQAANETQEEYSISVKYEDTPNRRKFKSYIIPEQKILEIWFE